MNLTDIFSKRLPLSSGELMLLMLTAPNRYKVHSIEKRHGRGKRLIAQPTAEVKAIQRIAWRHLKGKLPIHECAKAYQPDTSIKDHASPHASKRYLLKIDFKDFFPSIRSEDFCLHLERHTSIDRESIEMLARIFFWRPRTTSNLILAIGAPSSPWLSNTLLFDFDTRVLQYCKEVEIVYTRYADDLALSTDKPGVLICALTMIRKICADLAYPRLTINEEKTVFTSTKFNRTLTGLVLANDGSVSVGRDRKREIRALAKNYDNDQIDAEKIAYLRGILSFTLSVDQLFNLSIERMIGTVKYRQLMG